MRHVSICVALVLASCSPGPAELAQPPTPSDLAATPTPTTAASHAQRKTGWKKDRFISVAEAVDRLQPHVDVPVVLPRDPIVGNLKGWLADPRYLEWNTVDGVRAGSLKLFHRRQMLILSYGLAGFDGCGDRTMAIETNVLGLPALATQSPNYLWSHVIWPVTDTGSTGRYGITGTFEAVAMIRLAESMELARLEAMDVQKNC